MSPSLKCMHTIYFAICVIVAWSAFNWCPMVTCNPVEDMCHIRGSWANCSGHGHDLTYIPKLGSEIKYIVFDGNYLQSVSMDTFLNISVREIKHLELANDGIQNITKDALNRFSKLLTFDISKNKVSENQMKSFVQSLSTLKSLHKLFLNDLSWKEFPQDLFSNVNETNLKSLHLTSNGIKKIDATMLQNLKYLELLDVDHNAIQIIRCPVLHHLYTLYLKYNHLTEVPNFCVQESYNANQFESCTPALRNLYLGSNRITDMNNASFRCLTSLKVLDISFNYIHTFQNHMLSTLPNLHSLQIRRMYVPFQDIVIENDAFWSSSLHFLMLEHFFSVTTLMNPPKDIFAHIPNLKHLQFSKIDLSLIDDEILGILFKSLTNLQRLSLWGNKLTFIPNRMFANKSKLQNLVLANNQITTINRTSLKELANLEKLLLDQNNIKQVGENVLNAKQFNKLKILDMSRNPFMCTCNNNGFLTWLKHASKRINIVHYPVEYKCDEPSTMTGKQLAEVTFTYRECHPWGVWFWLGSVGGPVLLAIFIGAAIVFRNRWNIKHYIYLMRKRRQYERLGGHVFKFDAFVGYHQNDYEWVMDHLLPNLETNEGLGLCIHDRNFKPGVYIHDNITKCMEESRKIILVLTNNFAESRWCSFELKLSHTKHIEDGTDLIIVMLEKLKARNMSKSLKSLLQTTTYIEWTNDQIGRQLFWEKMKDSLKH